MIGQKYIGRTIKASQSLNIALPRSLGETRAL